jgi:hypothetical protein
VGELEQDAIIGRTLREYQNAKKELAAPSVNTQNRPYMIT